MTVADVHGEDEATERAVAGALSSGTGVAAVYSMGGGNSGVARALSAAGLGAVPFLGHDLDSDNLALLRTGVLTAVLHHDLRTDLRAALTQLFAQAPLQADQVVVALTGPGLATHMLSLPFTDPKRLEATIGFEVEGQLPFDLSEAVYDYQIASIRNLFQHADAARIDHVMGLHRLFWIPSELAYGDKPKREGAPAGPLVFDVELIAVQ